MPEPITSHIYASQWPPAPGLWRVALYKGRFDLSPIRYYPHSVSDRRTLKAAIRELAHIIARQSRRDFKGERYDSAYIISPFGHRLSLNKARAFVLS